MILEAGGNPFITYVPTLPVSCLVATLARHGDRRAPVPSFPPATTHPLEEPAQNTKSATSVIFVMGGVAW